MNYETGFEPTYVEPLENVEEISDVSARRRRWIMIVVAALVVLGLVAYFATRGGSSADSAADTIDQLPTVSVIVPGRTDVEGQITATGSLAARHAMPVGAVGEGGRVVAVPVQAGDWVRQGQTLAVIDRSVQTQQAQSAAAQVQVAQADANLAQANLDRAAKLVDRGFVSTADIDRLTATRDAAVARVRVAQAQLRQLQASNARLNIVAPASGYVLERNVEIGQTVGAGSQPLFNIAQGGQMEMLARVGEGDLAKLRVGMSASVTPAGDTRSYSGQIWQVDPTISEQDRQGTVRIALSFARGLRPGGFATALLNSGTVVAPVLPESAIMTDEKGDYVYILDGKDKVVRRGIEQGEVTGNGIVIAKGLNGTERVILRAGGFVNPGEQVKPVMAKG